MKSYKKNDTSQILNQVIWSDPKDVELTPEQWDYYNNLKPNTYEIDRYGNERQYKKPITLVKRTTIPYGLHGEAIVVGR